MSSSTGEAPLNGRTSHDGAASPPSITPLGVVNTVLRYRWLVGACVVIGLSLGYLSSRSSVDDYVATASFVTHGEGGGPSVPAGLARQYGLGTGSGSTDSPRFYAMLIKSRQILLRAGFSTYEVVDPEKGEFRGTLVDLYDWGQGSPAAVQRRTVSRLGSMVHAEPRSDLRVVDVRVTAPTGDVAEQLAMRLIELVEDYNRSFRQSRARSEEQFVTTQMASAQAELSAAESELQRFLRQNRQFANSPELSFEHDRLQRQVRMRQELVTALAQAEQQARIDAVRDTPVITVLESSIGAAQRRSGWSTRPILLAVIGSLTLALVLIFLIELFRRTRESGSEDYHDFLMVRDEIRRDMQRVVPLRRKEQARLPTKGGGGSDVSAGESGSHAER